jgi:ferric-dicitrate binding protein FerR (iron transport regulator)
MNSGKSSDSSTRNSPSDRPIAALLKLAGERDQPSADALEQARTAAAQSWRHAVNEEKRRQRTRWLRPLIIATTLSGVAAAFVLVVQPQFESKAHVPVAQVARIEGDVHRSLDAHPQNSPTLFAGETVTTSSGRMALAMGSLSLRVDRNTRLTALNERDFQLDYGRVYVDSGSVNAHSALRIYTASGMVEHRGTQFQVISQTPSTEVLVREGRVSVKLATNQRTVDLAAGEAVTIAGSNVSIRSGLNTHDAAWDWVNEIAPAFDIEGRPLAEFLAWITREHGWQLRFASIDLERTAQRTRLHGSLLSRSADQQLNDVGLMTATDLHVDQGVLIVEQAKDASL